MLDQPNWKKRALPIVLHADGGCFAKKNSSSLFVVSWRPYLCKDFDVMFLITAFSKLCCATHKKNHDADSMIELWEEIKFHLDAFFYGILPEHNRNGDDWPRGTSQAQNAGQEIADGLFFGVLWAITGDLECFGNELKTPHFNSLDPCWLCPCCRRPAAECQVTDVARNATFKAQLIKPSFATRKMPSAKDPKEPNAHPIWRVVGVSRWTAIPDLMHCSCIGVAGWLNAGVLHDLVHDSPIEGRSQAQKLDNVRKAILAKYKLMDYKDGRLSHLTQEMIRGGTTDFPYLSASATEAPDKDNNI